MRKHHRRWGQPSRADRLHHCRPRLPAPGRSFDRRLRRAGRRGCLGAAEAERADPGRLVEGVRLGRISTGWLTRRSRATSRWRRRMRRWRGPMRWRLSRAAASAPQVDGFASARERERINTASVRHLRVSEPDDQSLFHRHGCQFRSRRLRRPAAESGERRRRAEAQARRTDAAYLSLTGAVVTRAIEAASLRAQIEALDGIIADDQRTLDMIGRAIQAGGSPTVGLATPAEAQLAEDQGQATASAQTSGQHPARARAAGGQSAIGMAGVGDQPRLAAPAGSRACAACRPSSCTNARISSQRGRPSCGNARTSALPRRHSIEPVA